MTSRCSSAASTSRVHRPLTKAEAELAVITKSEATAAKRGVAVAASSGMRRVGTKSSESSAKGRRKKKPPKAQHIPAK